VWFAAATMLAVGSSAPVGAVNQRPIATVALEGQIAPGTGDATFTDFDEPMVNTANQVAFLAAYTGPGAGFFLWNAGVLSPIAVTGQVVPGVGTFTQTSLGGDDLDTQDGPAFNNRGTVAFVINSISGNTKAAVFQKRLNGPITVIPSRETRRREPAAGNFCFSATCRRTTMTTWRSLPPRPRMAVRRSSEVCFSSRVLVR
jgi:hypothetical protein